MASGTLVAAGKPSGTQEVNEVVKAGDLCEKCNGSMFWEWLYDLLGYQVRILARKCINCGNIVDPCIIAHRRLTPKQKQLLLKH